VDAASVDAAYAYCREIARAIGRTFYYGSLFLPPPRRRAAWALYAFCRTVDDIADVPDQSPEGAMTALAGWRASLLATYAGRPEGPVMTAWADVLRTFPVPLEPALELLDGVAMDVVGAHYESWESLCVYCYRVAGTVGLLMAPLLGPVSPVAHESAVDLGIAMQLTNILRDVGEDAANGRIYLPRDEMARFRYGEDELHSGVVTPAFRELMEFQMARAERHYERGMRGIALLDPEVRLAIALSATLYHAILGRIRRNGYDVFTRRAHIGLAAKLATLPGVWLQLPQGSA
jgi:phytoene synthase